MHLVNFPIRESFHLNQTRHYPSPSRCQYRQLWQRQFSFTITPSLLNLGLVKVGPFLCILKIMRRTSTERSSRPQPSLTVNRHHRVPQYLSRRFHNFEANSWLSYHRLSSLDGWVGGVYGCVACVALNYWLSRNSRSSCSVSISCSKYRSTRKGQNRKGRYHHGYIRVRRNTKPFVPGTFPGVIKQEPPRHSCTTTWRQSETSPYCNK